MIERGEIKPGMVVVFRYQGPKGGPGMPEMLGMFSAILLNYYRSSLPFCHIATARCFESMQISNLILY